MQIILSSITKKILDIECEEVYFITKNGMIGILNNHITEEFVVTTGELNIISKDNNFKYNLISGVACVENNLIKITAILNDN